MIQYVFVCLYLNVTNWFADSATYCLAESTSLPLESRLFRRILSSKGSVVVSRRIQQSFCGALKTKDIQSAMEQLHVEGLGRFDSVTKSFHKADPRLVLTNPHFVKYGIPAVQYRTNYNLSQTRYLKHSTYH
ncbi:hypothetical protein LSH36_375g02004 [Paralvinella palmiformis]|uniref:Uncharacterized protein n=1 Tax=Paralvinella palmiformis TaxID=53620 RepID=A0AAD9JEY4_9ANNE|nr:hypothetical protein LSH36_375g02004 [Paralvinella palmiformis]